LTEGQAVEYVKWKLAASPDAKVEQESMYDGLGFDLKVIEDDVTYLIEIKSRPSVDSLARLVMAGDLMRSRSGGKKRPHLVLASESLPNDLIPVAKELQIRLIDLPRKMAPPTTARKRNVKITTDRSWNVVSQLIRQRASTIQQISDASGVSYGWCHAVITHLIGQNIIAKQEGIGIFEVKAIDKLLNGIAWERQTLDLVKGKFTASSNTVYALARDVADAASNDHFDIAFACHLPGGIYTGHAMRHDSLHLYIDPGNMDLIEQRFASDGGDIEVQMLAPDRDVFGGAVVRESLPLTSPSQTLLDLAGLGHRGKDLTLKMMEGYRAIF
jgi:hypothetical protein